MAFQMTSNQWTTVTVQPKDAKGNPAVVQSPEWMTDNTDVLALEPAADGLSVKVTTLGPLGAALLTFKCDADLGEGVKPLIGTLAVEIVAGEAVTVELTAATPQEQTPLVTGAKAANK